MEGKIKRAIYQFDNNGFPRSVAATVICPYCGREFNWRLPQLPNTSSKPRLFSYIIEVECNAHVPRYGCGKVMYISVPRKVPEPGKVYG
jgi:hypothetical protein